MSEKLTKREADGICRQLGHELTEFAEFKAFADEEVNAADAASIAALPELPPLPTAPVGAVEEVTVEAKVGVDALIERLDAIIKDKEADKKDVKTAEELKGRLEELKAAEKNAEDFLAKAIKTAPAIEEGKGGEGAGAGTMEAEMTTPAATV